MRSAVVRKCAPSVQDQASYCMELGQKVCPKILSIGIDFYEMEHLNSIPRAALERSPHLQCLLLIYAQLVLKENVWNRPPSPLAEYKTWYEELLKWAVDKDFYWITDQQIQELYFTNPIPKKCMIHGDPTLANVMLRRNGDIILIDPIQPYLKIPQLADVDRGKLLQSATGWEHQLDPVWADRHPSMIEAVVCKLNRLETLRAWFWAMVHYSRIIPYAKDKKMADWAKNSALGIRDDLRIRLG